MELAEDRLSRGQAVAVTHQPPVGGRGGQRFLGGGIVASAGTEAAQVLLDEGQITRRTEQPQQSLTGFKVLARVSDVSAQGGAHAADTQHPTLKQSMAVHR